MDINQFFDQVDNFPDLFKCLVCAENKRKTPVKPLSGKKQWNLKKHLETVHPEIYDKHFNSQKKVNLLKKRAKIMQSMCEIVTINGRPFNYLLDSGFHQLIEDDLKELSNHGVGITLDRNLVELHHYIDELARKVRKKIESRVYGRFISLMLDAASKNNKSILGITAQYLSDGKINKNVLAMTHMENAHTSEYMQILVKRCLVQYNIPADHAISFTTDNASSMIGATKQFDEYVQEICPSIDYTENIDLSIPSYDDVQLSEAQMESIMETIGNIDEIRNILDDADTFEELYEKFIGDISKASKKVFTIRCGAHLNQLAVRCGLKKSNVEHLLATCKYVVKKLRTEKIKGLASDANLTYKIPSISCETRWDSDFDMVSTFRVHISFLISNIISIFTFPVF